MRKPFVAQVFKPRFGVQWHTLGSHHTSYLLRGQRIEQSFFFCGLKLERVSVFVILFKLAYFFILFSLHVFAYFLYVFVVQENIIVRLYCALRGLDGLQRLSRHSVCVVEAVV